ncbi:MAG: type II toxin-antitoxin system VapC family toxin [Terriglobia bacterium]
MIYVDTSVLAAYYCPEPLSVRAERALHEAGERAISWLVEVEFVSALARKVRTRELRPADAHRILAVFQSHLEQGIYNRLALNSAHFVKAREWLATFTIPLQALDALHVAVAAIENCSFLTADTALAKACAKAGVTARLIS